MPTAVKRLLLVVVVGALVVGATGCDLSPPAATVNGTSISQSTLNAALAGLLTDTKAQCATQLQSGLSVSPVGVGTEDDGTTANAVATSIAADVLQTLVFERLEALTLARHGVTVTRAEVAAATTDYESQLQGQLNQAQTNGATPTGCTLSAATAMSAQLSAGFLQRQGASLAEQEMLEVVVGHVDLSLAALERYYQAHLAQVTQVCLNLIVSDTQAGAQRLHDQIAAGATFPTASASADADKQVSPSGGEVACVYPSVVTRQFGTTLGASIDALKTGQLAEPLTFQQQSSTGAVTTYYLVFQMRQHQLVPFATLRSSIREAILAASATVIRPTLVGLVSKAHISVDPRYGTWSATRGVTVPVPPAPAFVLNAQANVPVKPLLSLPGLTLNPAPG